MTTTTYTVIVSEEDYAGDPIRVVERQTFAQRRAAERWAAGRECPGIRVEITDRAC